MSDFKDIEGELEPVPEPEPEQPAPTSSVGIPWGGILATIGLILVVVFAVQNTESTTIDFLWWSGSFPVSMVILVTGVFSALMTVVGGAFYRRSRMRRRAERQELRQLRGEN